MDNLTCIPNQWGWCRVGATGAQRSVNEWEVTKFVFTIVEMNEQLQNLCL